MRIKVQFALDETPICMSGTVRSVDYKEVLQRSLLHVEADPLPIYAQNKIMGEVFGMQDDDGDELPYRIPGENSGSAEILDPLNETPKNKAEPVDAAALFPQTAMAESLPLAAG